MVLKGILLRLSQILSAAVAIYLLLMAGTFIFQGATADAARFAAISAGVWLFWGLLTIFVVRSPVELIREVALVVYPAGALLSIGLALVFGYWMEGMIEEPEREIWTFVAAGILIGIVMVIKCFDIQWLRTADEVRPTRTRSQLDDEYGPLI